MRIAMIGTGYISLACGAYFAESGHDIVCADLSEQRIATLNNAKSGRLTFTPDLARAVARAAA